MTRLKRSDETIRFIDYRAPKAYGFDLEIIPASDLRRRVRLEILATPERIGFHMLICVTEGQFTHTIDAETYQCEPGTFLSLHPGQVQQYDTKSEWQGWLLMFRPQFLMPDETETPRNEQAVFHQLEALPTRIQFDSVERAAVEELIDRMHADGALPALRKNMHALLRIQLQALLMRIDILQRHHHMIRNNPSGALKRFIKFRDAVNSHYRQFHGVQDYATILRCSEKSLSRATQQMVGVSAKAFLKHYLILEAKRLLVHSPLQIAQISDFLGFDEPTNFGKFFLHGTGLTPSGFRTHHRARSDPQAIV